MVRSPTTAPRLVKLNEYHGFVEMPEGAPALLVGTVVPLMPTHVCPVVKPG